MEHAAGPPDFEEYDDATEEELAGDSESDYVVDEAELEEASEEERREEDEEDDDEDLEDLGDLQAGGDDEGEEDIFVGGMDPFSLLQGLEEHGSEGDGAQAFHMIAQARQEAMALGAGFASASLGAGPSTSTRSRKGAPAGSGASRAAVFGATVEEVFGATMEGGVLKKRRKKRRRRKRRARGDMPADAAMKVGKANLAYAMGRHGEATELLTDVIRQAPNAADSYCTMGMIHEDQGNTKKALAFFMIAAHLQPKKMGIEIWERVARLSQGLGYRRQALYCLTKAITGAPRNPSARWTKCNLLLEMGLNQEAVVHLLRLQRLTPDDANLAKVLARAHHQLGEPHKAVQVLENFVHSFPHRSDLTHVNMLCELYMASAAYGAASELIVRAQNVLCAGKPLPLDLQVKLGICALREGNRREADRCMQTLLQTERLADYSDLLSEAASAYMEEGLYEAALQYYKVLREQQPQGISTLQKMFQCYKCLGNIAAAAQLYEEAAAEVPSSSSTYMELTLSLCELTLEDGNEERARDLMGDLLRKQQSWSDGAHSDADLWIWRGRIQLQMGDKAAFVDSILPAIKATFENMGSSELNAMDWKLRLALERRLKLRQTSLVNTAPEGGLFSEQIQVRDRRKPHLQELEQNNLAILEEMERLTMSGGVTHNTPVLEGLLEKNGRFDLLLQVLSVLLELGENEVALELAERARQMLKKHDTSVSVLKEELRLFKIKALLDMSKPMSLWRQLRFCIQRWPTSLQVLNTYSRMLCSTGGTQRVTSLILTMRSQYPNSAAIALLAGHRHATGPSNETADALNEYIHAYELSPDEPLTSLCLGICLLKDAMDFRATHRHKTVLQAFSFLCKYRSKRDNPQEAAYNMGRAAHQLGLMHVAIPFYEQALALKACIGQGGEVEEEPDEEEQARSDLCREAAHNLVMIYKATGAMELAREVLHRHLTI